VIERATQFARNWRKQTLIRVWADQEVDACRRAIRELDERISRLESRRDSRGRLLADCLRIVRRQRIDLSKRNLKHLGQMVDNLAAEPF